MKDTDKILNAIAELRADVNFNYVLTILVVAGSAILTLLTLSK